MQVLPGIMRGRIKRRLPVPAVFSTQFEKKMSTRSQILRTGLKVIDMLLKGPVTVHVMADTLGLHQNQVYMYVKTLSEFLPIQTAKRKPKPSGRPYLVYWLEQ